MKKFILISAIILAVIIAGFLYIKYGLLKVKNFKPDNSKSISLLDLRPDIIAKLQQLVKDGSGGLYVLSIKEIEPDVLSSRLDVYGGSFSVDSAAMRHLDSLKKLPDDIYHITFDSLHMEAIGIKNLLGKNNIDIGTVFLTKPVISIYHKSQPYNNQERKTTDSLTLYQRLLGQLKKIEVSGINIDHGTLILYDVKQKNHPTKFNDITVKMNDVLIDSSTEYDAGRFLFAKQAVLETKNYLFHTSDSLYTVKLGRITLAGEKHSIIISDAALIPRGNREQFEKKLPGKDEMYTVNFPKITLSDVDWWKLVNKEKIVAKKTTINGGMVSIFYDKSLPYGPPQPKNRFPHQLVMTIPVPVLIDEIKVNDLKVKYEQYNPATKSLGASTFTNVQATVQHITNIPPEIKRSRYTLLSGSGLFMGKVPLTASFKLDLLKQKTGQFIADVHMATLDKDIINPVAEPLGQFIVKSGQMQEGSVHIEGDNFTLHATADIRYTDLNITPLKIDKQDEELKKNKLKGFFANLLFIKKANPKGGNLRQPVYDADRGNIKNFVSFVWKAIMIGLLKTVGIPVKLVIKND